MDNREVEEAEVVESIEDLESDGAYETKMDVFLGWVVCILPKFVCGIIWDLSESTGIPLGFMAPHIFGRMIGAKPMRVPVDEEEE